MDNLNQYQGRACITLDGITLTEHKTAEQITKKNKNVMVNNLNFSEKDVDMELDKCHQLGLAREEEQSKIVRFRSHAFKVTCIKNGKK